MQNLNHELTYSLLKLAQALDCKVALSEKALSDLDCLESTRAYWRPYVCFTEAERAAYPIGVLRYRHAGKVHKLSFMDHAGTETWIATANNIGKFCEQVDAALATANVARAIRWRRVDVENIRTSEG